MEETERKKNREEFFREILYIYIINPDPYSFFSVFKFITFFFVLGVV